MKAMKKENTALKKLLNTITVIKNAPSESEFDHARYKKQETNGQ